MGSRPVAGRPRFFGLAFIDICEYWFSLKASRGEARTSAPALTRATKDCVTQMTQADSVLSTPPTNTSAIDQPMFPPIDPTRRRFLAVAAVASVVSAGTLAAATAMDPSVPAAVTVPIGPDPIYGVIEQHRKAARGHIEAVRVQFAYEEHGGIQGERLEEYQRLDGETDEAYDRMEHASGDLVNTKPATLAGIVAVCRYVGTLLEGYDSPDLPEYISYDDDTQETPAEALCHTISAAIEELMKAAQT
jgi:hypothetical protein